MNELTIDTIINRDALYALRELPDESVHCCVTSPPYYALRDYGLDAQIGREDTPEEYIERLVAIFRELRRVLRSDGTFWLNIADTYCGTGSRCCYLGLVQQSKDSSEVPRSTRGLSYGDFYTTSKE